MDWTGANDVELDKTELGLLCAALANRVGALMEQQAVGENLHLMSAYERLLNRVITELQQHCTGVAEQWHI